MATLLLNDGKLYTDLSAITIALASLNLRFQHHKPATVFPDPLPDLLARDILTEAEKQQILTLHCQQTDSLKPKEDYLWCDLLAVHPGLPQLYTLAATQSPYHIHTDPESLYLLAGAAIFGFLCADGTQMKLLLQPHDYLYIPAGTEHWFSPTAALQMKAVRYFTTTDGWIPQYTGTEVRDPQGKMRFF